MTTATPVKTAPPLPGRPPAAAGAGGQATPNLDVVKILKRYAWLLMAAAVIGGGVGLVAHFALLRIYPLFKAQVIFQVLPPTTDITGTGQDNRNEDEQERFALTQVANIKSDAVIQRVVTDPRLQSTGGGWAKQWMENGQFQAQDASEWLYDNLVAKVIPNTDYIEMSLKWKSAADVTMVVALVKDTYLAVVKEQSAQQNVPQRTQLERDIRTYEQRYRDKQNERDQILKNDEIDSIDERYQADTQELAATISSLHVLRQTAQGYRTQLEQYDRELNALGGPTYSDDIRNAVEAEPMIQNIHQTIAGLEANKTSMQMQGFGPEHRQMKQINTLIDSWSQRLEEERNRLLRKRFDATVSGLRNAISVFTAQEADLAATQERLVKRLIDLTKTMQLVKNIEQEIDSILKTKAELESALSSMNSVAQLQTSTRVIPLVSERIPDKPVFPNIIIMVPAGIVLFLGLTTGVVFLRELLDQRVKGPGDIAMIPRTRVLGFVPDASEDVATAGDQVSRAFRTSAKGVVAESFRQLRAPLLKRVELTGHKTVMIMAGMPGSGGSSIVSNMAEACAAADRRVLIIDANFRRPAQHKIFGFADAPGLADVLAGETDLVGATQATNSPNLSVLTAGSARLRVVERLASDSFAALLAAAGASYDIVLIDVPPAIVAGDGLSVANKCDAAVLVVKAYSEKRGLVSRVRNELSDAKAEFLGVVVNGVRGSAGGYLRGNIRASQSYASEHA